MANERAILCGDVTSGSLPFASEKPVRLHLWGPHENVRLQINDIRSHLLQEIPPPFHDLVEIATCVYCADQAVTRGGDGVDDFGENWRRRLFFRIPVRNPDLWNESKLRGQLVETLSFLSEDEYHFEFTKLISEPPRQQHLDFGGAAPHEVILFSGGLDSLGGAVQEAVVERRAVALVSHRPTPKLARRYRKLTELLAERAAHLPLHIPIVINKAKSLGREYTQRTRSFLYAALGATVAQMFGLSRIKFYENGIVSFNLPVSPQVVGARATRTTHPQVINGFAKLISSVAGKAFAVENPFLWRTKAEVVKGIADAGCAEMIKFATSCSHTWELTRLRTHCGTCSQCIDRRFAVLASGLDEHDPAEAYGVDLLVGERNEGEPRTMLAAYVETANDMADMSALDFLGRYGEASRVLRHLDGSADSTALKLFELHQRHSKYVTQVIENAIAERRKEIRKRVLPGSCLLRLVYESSLPGATAAPPPGQPKPGDLPVNYIRRKGECWAIRFEGNDERIYTPDVGFYHLQILLEHPNTPFSASELDCAVSRRVKERSPRFLVPQIEAMPTPSTTDETKPSKRSDTDGVLDREALRSYRLRLEEISKGLVDAHKNNDLAETQRLEGQKQWIDSELSKARGLGGRIRELGDVKDKVRNRVCNAIRRALKKISEYDRPLSEHLTKPILSLGHTLTYVPRGGFTWSD